MNGTERYGFLLLKLSGGSGTHADSYQSRAPCCTQTWLTTLVWDSWQSERDGIMEHGVESSNNPILYPSMSH